MLMITYDLQLTQDVTSNRTFLNVVDILNGRQKAGGHLYCVFLYVMKSPYKSHFLT